MDMQVSAAPGACLQSDINRTLQATCLHGLAGMVNELSQAIIGGSFQAFVIILSVKQPYAPGPGCIMYLGSA